MEIVKAYKRWYVELWDDDTPERDHFERYFDTYDEAVDFVKAEIIEEWGVTWEEVCSGELSNYSKNSYDIDWADSKQKLFIEIVNGNRSDYLKLEPYYFEMKGENNE